MPSPIVLLTDFGHIDPYVGQMKGVLAGLAPEVPVIDLCHGVRPQAVSQAAYFLVSSLPHFPQGSIFVCVVDPGVGTDRSILCVHAAGRYILAPDNGLVLPLISDYPGAECYRMHLSLFEEASPTFHGRDIFCPLAARLAGGGELAELGTKVELAELTQPEWTVPIADGESVMCTIQHIDTFGNVVLNLPVVPWLERLALWPQLLILQAPPMEVMRTTTFGHLPKNTLGCIAGSQGYMEIVLNGASAAQHLKLDIGDIVTLLGSFTESRDHAIREQ